MYSLFHNMFNTCVLFLWQNGRSPLDKAKYRDTSDYLKSSKLSLYTFATCMWLLYIKTTY